MQNHSISKAYGRENENHVSQDLTSAHKSLVRGISNNHFNIQSYFDIAHGISLFLRKNRNWTFRGSYKMSFCN